MTAFGDIMFVVGLIAYLYGALRFLVLARNCSDFWFFGCLFLPFVDWLFLSLNFQTTVKPFILILLGLILMLLSG